MEKNIYQIHSTDGHVYETMDRSRAYIFESDPLEIALDPKVGDLIYTSLGDCYKCYKNEGGSLFFELVHPTVLADGSLLSELSETQLSLFWALSRTELKRHGIKNTS